MCAIIYMRTSVVHSHGDSSVFEVEHGVVDGGGPVFWRKDQFHLACFGHHKVRRFVLFTKNKVKIIISQVN